MIFDVFPNDAPRNIIVGASGNKLYLSDGRVLEDFTAGGTHYAILGFNHPEITKAVAEQLSKFGHIDYKLYRDPNLTILTQLILDGSGSRYSAVYFSGNGGSEGVEAAMKMSFQVHREQGSSGRRWFISREQSYHGATADALAIGDRPNLEIYREMLSPYRSKIKEHNKYRQKLPGETDGEYEERCLSELKDRILEIGPDKICAFVAEPIMGGLVGDVPPTDGYLRGCRKLCSDYGIHLILDEVYCGLGISGSYICSEVDNVTADFLVVGKTLAAGFGAISAVLTHQRFSDVIRLGSGRLQHSTTFQANSLAVAAAVGVQNVMTSQSTLARISSLGEFFQRTATLEVGGLPGFRNVRGRGLRQSIEYDFGAASNNFGIRLATLLQEKHGIVASCKWNRISFTPYIYVSEEDISRYFSKVRMEYEGLIGVFGCR